MSLSKVQQKVAIGFGVVAVGAGIYYLLTKKASKTTSQYPDTPLFQSVDVGAIQVPNRIVCAALTRCRANPADGVPHALHVEYYSQRAASGFMFTESCPISAQGNGAPGSACLYTDEQEKGWKAVVDAVHAKGGRIVLQMWHGGRTCALEGGLTALAPSAVTLPSDGRRPDITPKEMTQQDMNQVKEEYRLSAERAKRCGFDGIQMHCAYGYLLDSFLRDSVNKRTDNYGGSVENRARFPLEVLDVLIKVYGKDRVGVKLSPVNDYNTMSDSNPEKTVGYFIEKLNERNVAFLEVTEGFTGGSFMTNIAEIADPFNARFKKAFKGKWISNYGYSQDTATDHIRKGFTDLVSFGWPFVANPDLVQKFISGGELNHVKYIKDMSQFAAIVYYGGPLGYTDVSCYSPSQ